MFSQLLARGDAGRLGDAFGGVAEIRLELPKITRVRVLRTRVNGNEENDDALEI